MKHLKIYEDYSIDDIYNWWSGIKVIYEDEYYYKIQLKNVYLTNKIIQLRGGLNGKVVRFFCKEHKKYEESKIENVEVDNFGHLFFKIKGENNQNIPHPVEVHFPIEISKTHINMQKYNI